MIYFRTRVVYPAVRHTQEVGQFPRAGFYEQLTYLVLWISWVERKQEKCRVIMIYHIGRNLNMQYTGMRLNFISAKYTPIFKNEVTRKLNITCSG